MKDKIHKQFTIKNIDQNLFEEDINRYLSIGWDILDGSFCKESKDDETIYSQILVWRDARDSKIEFENNYPIKKTESIKGNKVRITKWFLNPSVGEGKISEIKEGYNNERYAKEGYSSVDWNGEYFQEDGEYKCYYENGNINYILYYEAGELEGKGTFYYKDGQLWVKGKIKSDFESPFRPERTTKGLITIYSSAADEFFKGSYAVNYSGRGAGRYRVFSQLIGDHLRDGYGPKIIFFYKRPDNDLASSSWRIPIFYCEVLHSVETNDVTTAEIKLIFFHDKTDTRNYKEGEDDFQWWDSFSHSTFKIEYGPGWEKLVPISINISSNGLKFIEFRDIYLFRDRLNVSEYQKWVEQTNQPARKSDYFDGNVIIYDQVGEPLIKFNNPLYFKELRTTYRDYELNPIETSWEWYNNDKMYKRAELSFYYMEEEEKVLHKWKNIGHNKHKDGCRVNYTLRCYDDYDELIFEGKGCKVNSKNNGKDCGWKIIVNSMTNSQNIDVLKELPSIDNISMNWYKIAEILRIELADIIDIMGEKDVKLGILEVRKNIEKDHYKIFLDRISDRKLLILQGNKINKDFSLSNFMPIKELFKNIGILNFKWFIFKAMRNAREIYYKQDGFYEQINKSGL